MKSIRRTDKRITLTTEQQDKVLQKLQGQQGDFDIYIELNKSLTIQAQGYVYSDGYVEDDYLNGTGAFIETGRTADVILTAFVSNDGEDEEVYDVESEFETECYNLLQAA